MMCRSEIGTIKSLYGDMTAQPLMISSTETHFSSDPQVVADMRRTLSDTHAALLPNIFDTSFRQMLLTLCDKASFVSNTVPGLGERSIEAPPAIAGKALRAALRRPDVLRFVERATGCGPLAAVEGDIAEFAPRPHEELAWHDDRNGASRRLAITVNLSDVPYSGGLFELREKRSRRMLIRHIHRDVGTALIFRVESELEHRVQPVTAGGPRRVFAGWFLAPQ